MEHGATDVSAPDRVLGGATGVGAPGRVCGLGHGLGDDIDMSYSDDGEVMA